MTGVNSCINSYKNNNSWQLVAIDKNISIDELKNITKAKKVWAYISGNWQDSNGIIPQGSTVWINSSQSSM